ncbi:MAG: putative bifunctional diguanylate cyclase/phosphodiesterase, partial [Acidimicrobiales bacterium]
LVATKLPGLLTERSRSVLDRFILNSPDSLQGEVVELEFRTQSRQTRTAEVVLSERADGIDDGFTITLRDITEQRRLERSLRDQALYDTLTGLANRETLHFDLQQRLQQLEISEVIGVIHLDIDDFKAVNDSVGFETGDELLLQVAARLRALLRSTDTLARSGGNEFAIISTSTHPEDVLHFADRLRSSFDEPFTVKDRQHRLSVSIGLETTDDRRSVARDLLEHASLALGEARKGSQKSAIEVFEPRMRASATERWELAADLEGAIERNELSVVYQPILQIESRNIRGVEALLRWTHPSRGPVSPGVFIPLAEKSGLVLDLGRWVLEQSCAQLAEWRRTVDGAKGLGVSVNVSALQLERKGEAEQLCQIVLDSGVDPGRVTFELTESTLIEDSTWIRSQLQALRDLGARVAIDDFGTGAAGLGHLRDVPFNVIKIDKSYVDVLSQQGEALRLIQGVIELAHTLGAETVAEGIEEPTEFELLQSLGCDMGQGFYLGRPMDPAQLEDWFAKGRTGSAPSLIVSQDASH